MRNWALVCSSLFVFSSQVVEVQIESPKRIAYDYSEMYQRINPSIAKVFTDAGHGSSPTGAGDHRVLFLKPVDIRSKPASAMIDVSILFEPTVAELQRVGVLGNDADDVTLHASRHLDLDLHRHRHLCPW